MGVYHLMGLGLSPGTVTGPLSYLAHRYQRWNNDDKLFFSRSGEARQRENQEKVGDVQSLVFFTTREVIVGKDEATSKPFHSLNYIENLPGRIAEAPDQPRAPMKEVINRLLKSEWSKISGGRQKGSIFWVEVDRRDIGSTYKRIIQVIEALGGVGGQGKEIWVNLTGGNNVTNFTLQLAATLSAKVARLYYVQAANPAAEKCVRFTVEEGYWVELPAMPLVLSNLNFAVLALLEQKESISSNYLYSQLQRHPEYWNLVQGISSETFKDASLTPMWKQGLIAGEENGYTIGSQWKLIKPYEEVLQQARQTDLTIEQLAQQETWIEREEIKLK